MSLIGWKLDSDPSRIKCYIPPKSDQPDKMTRKAAKERENIPSIQHLKFKRYHTTLGLRKPLRVGLQLMPDRGQLSFQAEWNVELPLCER
jgi:hypothetical protein